MQNHSLLHIITSTKSIKSFSENYIIDYWVNLTGNKLNLLLVYLDQYGHTFVVGGPIYKTLKATKEKISHHENSDSDNDIYIKCIKSNY